MSPSTPAPEFNYPRRVRFADCDPAGIVFYPRYFEMLSEVTEEWWRHMGLPWTELVGTRQLGTPISHLETQFLRPSLLGDLICFRLRVESLGRSSLRLQCRVLGPEGEERMHLRQRQVCFSLASRQAIAWPSDLKDAILKFQSG